MKNGHPCVTNDLWMLVIVSSLNTYWDGKFTYQLWILSFSTSTHKLFHQYWLIPERSWLGMEVLLFHRSSAPWDYLQTPGLRPLYCHRFWNLDCCTKLQGADASNERRNPGFVFHGLCWCRQGLHQQAHFHHYVRNDRSLFWTRAHLVQTVWAKSWSSTVTPLGLTKTLQCLVHFYRNGLCLHSDVVWSCQQQMGINVSPFISSVCQHCNSE